MQNISRRKLLIQASALAASSFVQPVVNASPNGKIKFSDYPFKLGVASGDPVTDGFVLWTKLSTAPLEIGSIPPVSIPVRWEISTDRKFNKIAQAGTALAHPEHGHSVHVEVSGLPADDSYFYRFIAGGVVSDIGRSRTLPIIGMHLDSFKFAFASCQDISNGYFSAYRDMVEQEPSLVIHTGDYIYEGVYRDGGRRIPVPEAISLEDYRLLYARYKMDPDLQSAHANIPWIMVWDDHEVENDWGGQFSESTNDPKEFLKRKTAAMKAYYEHLPLRLSSRLRRGESRIYKRTLIGNLVEFNLLDCRQYRDTPPCRKDGIVPNFIDSSCVEALADERSMLGSKQERWLRRGFGHQGVKWNTLVQTAYMAPFDYIEGTTKGFKTDGWDGYAASRQRILDLISDKKIKNPVAIGGEIHASYAGVVNQKAFDFESPAVLSELICTSISSGGGGDERYNKTMGLFEENPFARYFENRMRGYTMCHIDHDKWVSSLRVSSNVRDPKATFSTHQDLVIENGVVDIHLE